MNTPWMQSVSGRRVDLIDTKPDHIRLYDIAWSLARLSRFGGNQKPGRTWTVAEHCLLVESLMPGYSTPEARLTALLHDAPEYMTGDITTPMKNAVRRLLNEQGSSGELENPLSMIESHIEIAIQEHFELPFPGPAVARQIKNLDAYALEAERAEFMAPAPEDWGTPYFNSGSDNPPAWPAPLSTAKLADKFMARVIELMSMRGYVYVGEKAYLVFVHSPKGRQVVEPLQVTFRPPAPDLAFASARVAHAVQNIVDACNNSSAVPTKSARQLLAEILQEIRAFKRCNAA